jgi:leucyl-tRNA synthetase
MNALSFENKNFNFNEPFYGLFTQGMVCHETYKDKSGNWISPDEIINVNGEKYLKKDQSQKIKIGPSESMSKSKKNTIDPEKIISDFGADSVRLFILSDSPPEKDVQWSDEGIISSFKFLQKLWNLNSQILDEIQKDHKKDHDDLFNKMTNNFVDKVTNNLTKFTYNKIIANLHEMHSEISSILKNNYSSKTILNNYKKILVCMIPVTPHFANECISKLGDKTLLKWPDVDKAMLLEENIKYVIQINGKKRGLIDASRDISEKELLDLMTKTEEINKYLNNKKIKKQIFVPNKLINIIL